MLGIATTTELQLLAAREHAAVLAEAFPVSREADSARDDLIERETRPGGRASRPDGLGPRRSISGSEPGAEHQPPRRPAAA
jgi:hypothetical protein